MFTIYSHIFDNLLSGLTLFIIMFPINSISFGNFESWAQTKLNKKKTLLKVLSIIITFQIVLLVYFIF